MIANNPPATRKPSMMTPQSKNLKQSISRRAILKDLALTPLLLQVRPAARTVAFRRSMPTR